MFVFRQLMRQQNNELRVRYWSERQSVCIVSKAVPALHLTSLHVTFTVNDSVNVPHLCCQCVPMAPGISIGADSEDAAFWLALR
jgi:hypothetical protein